LPRVFVETIFTPDDFDPEKNPDLDWPAQEERAATFAEYLTRCVVKYKESEAFKDKEST